MCPLVSPLHNRNCNVIVLYFVDAGLRKHDVAFLLTVRPEVPIGYEYKYTEDFVSQVGLVYVRGCEIEGMLDEQGKVIEEGQCLVSMYEKQSGVYVHVCLHACIWTCVYISVYVCVCDYGMAFLSVKINYY